MTNGSGEPGIKAAIWLTCHSRMLAEKRYRRYEYISHLLLSWLALGVIAWAVVRTSQPSDVLLDTYSAILSAFVFAISIIVFGFRFGETAALHRECYLRLQKLHDSESEPAKLTREYHEILGAYGNHNDTDFEALIIDRTLLNNRKVWGKDGREITWSVAMVAKYVIRKIALWSIAVTFFILGLVPYLLIFKIL